MVQTVPWWLGEMLGFEMLMNSPQADALHDDLLAR